MRFFGDSKVVYFYIERNIKLTVSRCYRDFARVVSRCGVFACCKCKPIALVFALCNGEARRIMCLIVFYLDKSVGVVCVRIAGICIVVNVDNTYNAVCKRLLQMTE